MLCHVGDWRKIINFKISTNELIVGKYHVLQTAFAILSAATGIEIEDDREDAVSYLALRQME